MRPLSFSDRYWFVKLAIGIIALVALVVVVLLSIKSCSQEPHTHTESDKWIISKAASCTTEGARYKVCTGCGEQMKYEIIPAKGHTPGAAKDENRKNSSCTVQGSVEHVVYCTACRVELSREKETLKLADAQYGAAVIEDVVEPTCTKYGSYNTVQYCSICKNSDEKCDNYKKVEEVIVNPTGHSYEWETFYNNETHTVNLRGICSCNEENNVYDFTPDNSGLVVTRDESYAVCCKWHYTVTMTYYGEEVVEEYTHPVDAHKIISYESTLPDGTVKTAYIPISDYICTDMVYVDPDTGNTEICYNYNGTDRNGNHVLRNYVMYKYQDGWDENGFCTGSFVCVACEDADCANEAHNGTPYVTIILYNAEYDQRLQ